MAPFADAVRFVNGHPSKLTLMMDLDQEVSEVVECTEFWSNIEKSSLWMATEEIILDLNAL